MRWNLLVRLERTFLMGVLALLPVACSSNNVATDSGTGAVVAKIVWSDTAAPQAKKAARAAVGVASVKIVVTGPGMAEVQKVFRAVDGGGEVKDVPAGSGRTVKAQGLDENLHVLYQGEVGSITIQPGQTTDVGIITLQPLSNPPDETEPNDSKDSANVISIGAGPFRGQLSGANDVDWYEFISNGGAVEFSMRSEVALSFDEKLRVSIIAQDGLTVLASTVITGSDTAIPVLLGTNTTAGSRYYLRFDKVPSEAGTLTKAYLVTPTYSPKLYETESNDSGASASQIVVGGGTFQGQLSDVSDVDYFKFVSTGGSVQLSMVSDSPPSSSETVRCSLLDADGQTVLASTTISGSDTLFPVRLGIWTANGATYYLRFDKDPSSDSVFHKAYIVTPVYSTRVYESEPNNAILNANQISMDGSTWYGQLYDATDVDYYRLVATSNSVQFGIFSEGATISGVAIRATILDQDGTTPLKSTTIKGSDISVPIALGAAATVGRTYYLRLDRDPATAKVFTKSYAITSN